LYVYNVCYAARNCRHVEKKISLVIRAFQVSIEFNSPRAQPGHPATLSLSAEPESLCSVAVVDKSIELMGAKYITKQSVGFTNKQTNIV